MENPQTAGAARERPLSPSEVAGQLGCSAETVRRACARGELGYWFGGRWYIYQDQVEAIKRGEGRRP